MKVYSIVLICCILASHARSELVTCTDPTSTSCTLQNGIRVSCADHLSSMSSDKRTVIYDAHYLKHSNRFIISHRAFIEGVVTSTPMDLQFEPVIRNTPFQCTPVAVNRAIDMGGSSMAGSLITGDDIPTTGGGRGFRVGEDTSPRATVEPTISQIFGFDIGVGDGPGVGNGPGVGLVVDSDEVMGLGGRPRDEDEDDEQIVVPPPSRTCCMVCAQKQCSGQGPWRRCVLQDRICCDTC